MILSAGRRGESVKFHGLGTLQVVHRAPREIFCVKSQWHKAIGARTQIRFRPGKELMTL